ncbi:MAG: putative hydrolase [Actinomycetia bacterium]|nr:putative hydrolase [Actinomycetes bacterium]
MGQGPFPFGFDPAQLMRMLQSEGPVNWEVARQIAGVMAVADAETGEPRDEPPVDMATMASFDAVVRAAQVAVTDATGLGATGAIRATCVDRRTWAEGTLDGLRPVLETLAGQLQQPLAAIDDEETDGTIGADPLAGLATVMMPILLGVWAGSMIGYLAQQALGQYDLALPLQGEPRLWFVASNVDEFARGWSLPTDDLRYALALRESVHAAQRTVPWVRDQLVALSSAFVGAYEITEDFLEGALGDLDLSNLANLTEVPDSLGDPTALLGAMRSERQAPMLEALQRFVTVLEGYTDVVAARLGGPMITSFDMIDEALRRHRVERGQAAGFVDQLLGLQLDREHYERGVAFCRGVVERSGNDGLNRLWEGPAMIPTPAELDAPGLWLARIEL